MKIIIDNNIIKTKNIEKIKNSTFLAKVKNKEFEIYACDKLLSQLVPHLNYLDKQKRAETVNFMFEIIDNDKIFAPIAEIANREIQHNKTNNTEQFWFNKIDKSVKKNLKSKKTLDFIETQKSKEFSEVLTKHAHKEIKKFQETNRNLLLKYNEESYQKIDENICKSIESYGFDEITKESFIKIVKSDISPELPKEKQKEMIYKNLFDKLIEFNFLLQLKEQITDPHKKALINDITYINNYYNNYFENSFVKTLIKATLFGYSYKTGKTPRKYDEDWVNDTSYICCSYYADILLTNDTKYLKDAFLHIYGNTKEIITLDDFLIKYCK